MNDASKENIAALKRQRAHLREVDADPAKVAENAEFLRRAGVDVDELDNPKKEEPKREAAPSGRNSGERQTADAPTAPKRPVKPASSKK